MSALDLQTRLKSLSEHLRSTSQLISRLSKLSSTSPSSDPQIDPAQIRLELSTEIHQSFKELEEDYELIKQEAEDFTVTSSWSSGARRSTSEKDNERAHIATQVERLAEDLKLERSQFRKAQLAAKRAEEATRRKEREELFAGAQEGAEARTTYQRRGGGAKGKESLTKDELLLNASSDVTAALRRTHQLLQNEVQRSEFARETLQRSTSALQSLNETYSALDTLLVSSKSLVSTLLSSQKSDTWYLETALYILVATISWLFFRRIIYGPVRYLLYIPTKWMLQIFLSFLNLLLGLAAGSEDIVSEGVISSSRSLIIKPSATGRGTHRFDPGMARPSIPAGAGGRGAKEGKEGGEGEGLREKLERMVERSQDEERRERQQQRVFNEKDETEGKEVEDEDVDVEEEDDGEGEEREEQQQHRETVLREPEEGEAPNAKKRMWEEPESGEEGGHDEL